MIKTDKPEAYDHQKEIFNKSLSQPNLAFLWEMGTGKTRGLIDVLEGLFTKHQGVISTLIFSPLVTLYNWKDEFALYSGVDPRDIHVIDGKTKVKRLKQLLAATKYNKNAIIIINYEAVQTDDIFQFLLKWNPEVVVGDEMHLLKNYKSKRAKKVVMISDKATYRYGLTGTPILNSIEDIFHQFRFLDGGKLFGKSFFVFQSKYLMNLNANNPWINFPDWRPRPETFKELNEKIYSIATRVTKEDCLKDLPPLVKQKRMVELSKEQRKMYKQMKKEFVAFIQDKMNEGQTKAVVAQLAVTKALRLQQIVSGFVVTDEMETIEIKENPRLTACESLVEELTPNHKIIIWCCFKHDYKILGRLCDKLKIGHSFITGDMDLQKKQEAMNAFRKDDETRVIIANRRAGGIGINLVEASYSIVYSRNFSLGDELQSEARNHRGGSQIHKCITKIDLVAKDTIDELILEALNNKQKISDQVIDWMEE